MRASRGAHLVTLVVSLGVAIALGEATLRWLVPAPWIYPVEPVKAALFQPHPTRSYGLRPHATLRWRRADFDVAVEVNGRGLRDAPFADAGSAELRVLAAGDSFTFGIGVEASETWAEQLEARLNERDPRRRAAVVNTGVPGYSPTQIRQAIEEFAPELRPQAVIVGMYASSYWRVKDSYELVDGALVQSSRVGAIERMPDGTLFITAYAPGGLRDLDLWLKRYFHIGARVLSLANGGRHWPRSAPRRLDAASIQEDYQPALDEFSRIHARSRREGWVLIVLAINRQNPDGSFHPAEARYNEVLREFCVSQGIAFVDPLPQLRSRAGGRPVFRRPADLHWTPEAHRLAAELLLQRLDEMGVL